MEYTEVPAYRRNGIMSTLVFAALILGAVVPLAADFLPVLDGPVTTASQYLAGLSILGVCVVVLTGPVYLEARNQDGTLKEWGVANKVVAALLLALWIYGMI